jgi:hypothetical protein
MPKMAIHLNLRFLFKPLTPNTIAAMAGKKQKPKAPQINDAMLSHLERGFVSSANVFFMERSWYFSPAATFLVESLAALLKAMAALCRVPEAGRHLLGIKETD